jgi:hypothetical protein
MEGIVLIITLAIIVEALIEYAKSIGKAIVGGGWKTAVTQLIAIICAIVLCFASGADLFAAIGLEFVWPWLGVVLTGIIISRGANYVSDFITRLQGNK